MTLGTINYLNKIKRETRLNVKGEEGKCGVSNKEIDTMECTEFRAVL